MKPDWDKLAAEFDSNKNVAIVDVDCTSDDSKDLKKFADENLGPSCSPDEPNFSEYCSDEQKEAITALKEKGADALKEEVDAAQEAIDTAEKTFKDELAKLQASYEQLSKDKEATIAENSKDLGMKRNVLKSLTAESAAKDEL